MKGSKAFEETIKSYLDNRAATDELFAASYAKEGKNLADCITYIITTVSKSGCNGFPDEEIFSMAVHYYDEDDIKVGALVGTPSVVVNHTVELSPEEVEQAHKAAMDRAVAEQYAKITKTGAKPKATKTEPVAATQTLF